MTTLTSANLAATRTSRAAPLSAGAIAVACRNARGTEDLQERIAKMNPNALFTLSTNLQTRPEERLTAVKALATKKKQPRKNGVCSSRLFCAMKLRSTAGSLRLSCLGKTNSRKF